MNPSLFINAIFALLLIAAASIFTILSVGFGVISFFLARRKGISVLKWTILGVIPIINVFCVIYLVGLPPNTTDDLADQRGAAEELANEL
jgi:uncharacterized membrane protein